MTLTTDKDIAQSIQFELESTRSKFHALLQSLSEEVWRKQSLINWFNALGARMQGKVFTYKRIEKLYDRIHASLLTKIASIKDR